LMPLPSVQMLRLLFFTSSLSCLSNAFSAVMSMWMFYLRLQGGAMKQGICSCMSKPQFRLQLKLSWIFCHEPTCFPWILAVVGCAGSS
jgi:hypothetical protein